MPAYQAELTLERTVLAIPAGVADELILVDDASRDGTADLARKLGLQVHVHPVNRGTGPIRRPAIRWRSSPRRTSWCCCIPDYQYEPKAVPLLIAPILAGDADMTFGSRFAGMGDPLGGGMPRYRYLGNRVTTSAQNLMLGTRFTDMHSGMRAYTRACLESLPFLTTPKGSRSMPNCWSTPSPRVSAWSRSPSPPGTRRSRLRSRSCGRSHTCGAASSTRRGGEPFAGGGAADTCRGGGDRGGPEQGQGVRSAWRDASRAAASGCICDTRRRPPATCPWRSSGARPRRSGSTTTSSNARVADCSRRRRRCVPTRSWRATRRSSTRSTCPRRRSGASSSGGCPSRWMRSTCRGGGCSRSAPTWGCSSPSRQSGAGMCRASSRRPGRSSRGVSDSASTSDRARSRRSTSSPARSTPS